MSKENLKLNCKKPGCQRVSLELCVNENGTAVIRVKNRHDGEIHTSEFEIERIKEKMALLIVQSAA